MQLLTNLLFKLNIDLWYSAKKLAEIIPNTVTPTTQAETRATKMLKFTLSSCLFRPNYSPAFLI